MTYAIERLIDEIEENSMEKGMEKGLLEVAKKMLIKNKTIQEIQEITNLTFEKILLVKDELADNE